MKLFARGGLWRRMGWKDIAVAVLAALVLLFIVLGYFAYTLPLPEGFAETGVRPSMLLRTATGEAFAGRGQLRGEALGVADLPPYLVQAVIAVEDRRFYQHGGLDLRGIGRALVVNIGAGSVREGGSTITQQLAKLSFLEPDRTIKRKLQDMMLALWLENRLGKDEILGRYLNRVYFGAGAYGIEAAAQRYFGKSARHVTLAEAAMLAGLIQAPSALSPVHDLAAAQERASLVLGLMAEQGYITEDDVAAARLAPAILAVAPDAHPGWNYFADWAEESASQILGPMTADLVVTTTLDPLIQDAADATVRRWDSALGQDDEAMQMGLVAMTLDGAVVAMVGGRDYGTTQFNRATKALRQPGSAFKLFVYLAALDAGFTPDSRAVDEPVEVEGWRPRNYSETYRGAVPLRTAFAESINTVAVKLAEHVGRDRVIGVARLLGITTDLQPTPSMALGSFEVRLLELTGAYAAIAADVKRVEPYGIREIRGHGQTLWEHRPPASMNRGVLPWKRDQMVDMLMATVQTGTGRAAAFSRASAGKTGTSEDNRDGWYIGFTGDLVVGVWVGRDDNQPVEGLNGGGLPARIWRDFMIAVYAAPAGGAVASDDIQGAPLPADGAGPEPMTLQDIGDVIRRLFQ